MSILTCAKGVTGITQGLSRAVAAGFRRGLMSVAMIVLVCRRILRAEAALLALVERLRSGWVWVARAPASPRPGRVAAGGDEAPVRLPRGFGWLCALVPSDAACFGGQLRTALAEPGMVALLASCPQAVRILAPICRMVGVEHASLLPSADAVAAVGPIDLSVPDPVAVEESARDREARLDRERVELALVTAGMGWILSVERAGLKPA